MHTHVKRRDFLRSAGFTGAVSQQLPERLVLSTVGSRFTFGA